jgi:hypothetical protein
MRQVHCKVDPIYVFLFRELRGFQSQFPQLNVSCERFLYISRFNPHIFLRPRSSFSGNICFEFSALVLCSVGYLISPLIWVVRRPPYYQYMAVSVSCQLEGTVIWGGGGCKCVCWIMYRTWQNTKTTFPVLLFDFRCYLFLLLGLLPCQTPACKQGSVRSSSSYAAGNQ